MVDNFLPAIKRAATFAIGTPVALLTNGTVRDARGFTSKTYTVSRWMAYCTFIKPTTFKASARRLVYSRMVSKILGDKLTGGNTQEELAECTTASSMCSIIPPI